MIHARSRAAFAGVLAMFVGLLAAMPTDAQRRKPTDAEIARIDGLLDAAKEGDAASDAAFDKLRSEVRRIVGLDSEEWSRVLQKRIEGLARQFRLADMEPLLREQEALERRLDPDDAMAGSRQRRDLAQLVLAQGRYDEGQAGLEKWVRDNVDAYGADSWEALDAMSDLSTGLLMVGDLAGAERVLRQRLTAATRTAKKESDLSPARFDLSSLLMMQGRFNEAAEHAVPAFNADFVTFQERPALHFERYMHAAFNLIPVLQGLKRSDRAESRLREVLENARRLEEAGLLYDRAQVQAELIEQQAYFHIRANDFSKARPFAYAWRDRQIANSRGARTADLASFLVAMCEYRLGNYDIADLEFLSAESAMRGQAGGLMDGALGYMFAVLRAEIALGRKDWAAARKAAATSAAARQAFLGRIDVDATLPVGGMMPDRTLPDAIEIRSLWQQKNAGQMSNDEAFAAAFQAAQRSVVSASRGLDVASLRQQIAARVEGDLFGAYEAAVRELRTVDALVSSALSAQGSIRSQIAQLRLKRAPANPSLEESDARLANEIRVLGVRRDQAKTKLDAAENMLRSVAPQFHELLRPRPLTIQELQTGSGSSGPLLQDDEALVLFSTGSRDLAPGTRRGFVFVVTRTNFDWAEVGMEPAELQENISQLRSELDSGSEARGFVVKAAAAAPFSRGRAFSIYSALFGDPKIARLLASHSKWLLAPQGDLLSLPFAALVTETPLDSNSNTLQPDELRRTHWLGKDRALTIVPGAPSLRTLRTARLDLPSANRPAFFGIGDPAVPPIPNLGRLSHASGELRALSRVLNGSPDDLLLGANATEAGLRAKASTLQRARIVAFATHGLLSNQFSEPALLLSASSGDGRLASNDGFLTASEAAYLPLTADLVLLSACHTGAGDGSNEGLSGLARAFFHAGAGSLLVSQWSVRDDVAARITTRVIGLMTSDGLAPAEALKRAALELMNDTSADGSAATFAHPSAWAAFIVAGA